MTQVTLDAPLELYLRFNFDKLSALIRGGLSEYYNHTITAEVMESLTHKLIEDIEKLMNTESQ